MSCEHCHEEGTRSAHVFYQLVDRLVMPYDLPRGEPRKLEVDAVLQQVAHNVNVMMGSAKPHGEEWVTGYSIQTGGIHRIIGILEAAGYRLILPAL